MPVIEMAAVTAGRAVVGSALSPLSSGIGDTWMATATLGPNSKALETVLLSAEAILESTRGKEIHNRPLAEQLWKLRDLAFDAKDALDELDYFRIQDEIEGTYETSDRGCFHDLIRDIRHTTRAVVPVRKLRLCLSCCAQKEDSDQELEEDAAAERRCQAIAPSPSHTGEVDVRLSGCMARLASSARSAGRTIGKGIPSCCYRSPSGNDSDNDSDCGNSSDSGMSDDGGKLVYGAFLCKSPWKKQPVRTPKLELNRVDLSKRMKSIIDELQPLCASVSATLNLQLGALQMLRSTADRPKTAPLTEDPHLYGRDVEMKFILDGITRKFCAEKNLTVIPIVGHGGIGKTTFAQHVYENAKSAFDATIWICVSSSYNMNKLMQEMKGKIPEVQGENKNTSDEELIQQRLKSRRFLLVLDDIWKCHEDDWRRMLAPLRTGEARGNMVLFTTRIPDLATKLGTSKDLIIELNGLTKDPFEKYFLGCVFGQQPHGQQHDALVKDIGSQIVDKLKGFPLAAKTVGRLLRSNISEDYWRRVLESKEWERQTADLHDIMPALKLSYDYLPFHLQQCFVYCVLFPEDYVFHRETLIRLWIGIEILHASGQNRIEDIGNSYLDELLMHGFFNDLGEGYYVIHDLLRDLALMISSNECLSICYPNVRSVEIHPSVRHLSIIIDHADSRDSIADDEYFIRELRRLKERLNVKKLQTLMLFDDDGLLKGSFGFLFKEVNSLRVLIVSATTYPVVQLLENFSNVIHLRYLSLGCPNGSETQIPSVVSRFYHLRILNLKEWGDLPNDMSNLVNLHYFIAQKLQHSEICMVGNLKLLRELKMFPVKKRKQGFYLKELNPLMELNRLGIYNLENVLIEEAGEANLADKIFLQKLTLHWGGERSRASLDVESHVLESLRPHRNLKELRIIGHKGGICPTWLKQVNLRSFIVRGCQNLSFLPPIPWTHTLCLVTIDGAGSALRLYYQKYFSRMIIYGTDGLRLDEVLAFHNLTELEDLTIQRGIPLAAEHFQQLRSLKRLSLCNLDKVLRLSSNGAGDVKWQLPVKQLVLSMCSVSGTNLTRLLYHFPMLSSLQISDCTNIKRIAVMVTKQKQTWASAPQLEDAQLQQNRLQQLEEEEIRVTEELQQEEGLLVLPPRLCVSLQDLKIEKCRDLVLVQQGGGLQGLTSLVSLETRDCPSFLSAYASSTCPFSSSLRKFDLTGIQGIKALGSGGEGSWPLLTQGYVTNLSITCSNTFWRIHGCRSLSPGSFINLTADDAAGLFTTPLCSLLSSTLTVLCLSDVKIVTFTPDQENAFQLLTSLQLLQFRWCRKLKFLPRCLYRFSKLEKIDISNCPSLRWSNQRLPSSLQVLDVSNCYNDSLKQECRRLKGTIPDVQIGACSRSHRRE